jgi:hypothetical protein
MTKKLKEFQGRVYLVEAVNELEAWLLIVRAFFAIFSKTIMLCQRVVNKIS